MTVFRGRSFEEVIKLRGPLGRVLIQSACLWRKRPLGRRHAEGRPCRDRGRGQREMERTEGEGSHRGERPREEPALPSPGSQTPSLQDRERVMSAVWTAGPGRLCDGSPCTLTEMPTQVCCPAGPGGLRGGRVSPPVSQQQESQRGQVEQWRRGVKSPRDFVACTEAHSGSGGGGGFAKGTAMLQNGLGRGRRVGRDLWGAEG